MPHDLRQSDAYTPLTTEKFRGFGFVTFRDEENAFQVLQIRDHFIKGEKVRSSHQVQVKAAMDKEASNKKVLDEKERKVFVVSLPHDISTDDLHRYFARFGCIEEVRIIKDKEVGTMRGFGFILFQDRLGYIRVFEEGDFHVIKGKQVE